MPSFDEMLKNMPLHYAFYLRGVMNSVLPDFMNPVDREITEKNISGEALELFRGIAQSLAPDMKDGEVMQMSQYTGNVDSLLYYDDKLLEEKGTEQLKQTLAANTNMENSFLADQLRNALGNFGLTRVNGQYVIFDTYDFKPDYRARHGDTFFDAVEDLIFEQDPQSMAQEIGQVLMPETRDDNMKIRIRIPNEPSVIDVDYDDPIPDGAEDFVFRGPMTNKRKSMFDAFTSTLAQGVSQLNPISTAEAQMNDNLDPKLKRDLSTMRILQIKGKDPFPMDGNDEYGRMNDAQRAIADMDLSYLDS